MSESNSSKMYSEGGQHAEGEEFVIIPADRSDEERREAYTVDWQEPANKLTFVDRVRSFF